MTKPPRRRRFRFGVVCRDNTDHRPVFIGEFVAVATDRRRARRRVLARIRADATVAAFDVEAIAL